MQLIFKLQQLMEDTRRRWQVTLHGKANNSTESKKLEKKKIKSSVKPYTEDVILPLWQPARGCRTAVADAVVSCSETGAVAPGRIRSDLWHFSNGTAYRSHTAGRSCVHFHGETSTFTTWSQSKAGVWAPSAAAAQRKRPAAATTDLWAQIPLILKCFYSTDPPARPALEMY